jgi:hypothetical protein
MLAGVFKVLPNPAAAPLLDGYYNVGLTLSAASMRCHLWHVNIGKIDTMTLILLLGRIMFGDFKFTTALLKLKYVHTCSIVPMNLDYLCNLGTIFPAGVPRVFSDLTQSVL